MVPGGAGPRVGEPDAETLPTLRVPLLAAPRGFPGSPGRVRAPLQTRRMVTVGRPVSSTETATDPVSSGGGTSHGLKRRRSMPSGTRQTSRPPTLHRRVRRGCSLLFHLLLVRRNDIDHRIRGGRQDAAGPLGRTRRAREEHAKAGPGRKEARQGTDLGRLRRRPPLKGVQGGTRTKPHDQVSQRAPKGFIPKGLIRTG